MAGCSIIDSDDDLDIDIEEPFGTFRADIVGLRYYKGRVNTREMVSLQREPHNMYDCNAIRVDNIFGVQVGHIKREQARVLAKIVDNKRAKLEGLVPFGVNNKYSMPCDITFWGNAENRAFVINELGRNGFNPAAYNNNIKRSGSDYESGLYLSQNSIIRAPVKVSADDMKKELEQLFEKITENAKAAPQEPANGLVKKKARKRSQAKPKKEVIIDILDSEDDDEEKNEDSLAPPLPSFNAKDDPEFNVAMEVVIDVKPKATKRPQRAVKRPAKYTFDDNDNDDGNEHALNEKDSSVKEAAKVPRRERSSNQSVVEAPFVVENEVIISTSPASDMVVEEKGNALAIENEVAVSAASVTDSAIEETENTSPGPVHNTNQLLTYKSKKTKASGSRATLIICPLSVLGNWQDEISNHVWPDLLDVYTYYGSDRTRDSEDLVKKDIVLTTYQTVSSDKSKGNSPLKAIKWLRIVLDEGHIIRNPSTRQAKATHELKAERRWVVTGTPIQNSLKDLWSIICFLRLDPFTDRQWWRRVIERPIKDGEQDALVKLRQLMKVIALRRTKTQLIDGKPIVQLPEKSIFMDYIELSPEERDIYKAVSEKGKVTIGKYMKAGTLLKNYTEVLAILTRLRQLCCHPKLCTAALEAAAKEAVENSTPEELRRRLSTILAMVVTSGVDEDCPICLDSLNVPVITHCAHIFCKKCIEDVIKFASDSCPMCRGVISIDKLVDAPSDQEEEETIGSEWTSSAKVDALVAALEKQRMADPSRKCLVVSQFVSFLKLLKQPLEGRGFIYRLFDGSLSQEKRVAAIREFTDCTPGSPTIFLMSLKTGGVGLNLTAASRVYLMDPAWNPAAEDQCFDRCHRLGQLKAVEIHKFIVKDSVEERMLDMQERKRKLMTGAFAKPKAEEARRQKMNDVVNLFA